MRLRENSRSASAVATFLPRMSCANRFSFCGLTRSMRATALASLSASARSRPFLLMVLLPASRTAAGRRRRCGAAFGGSGARRAAAARCSRGAGRTLGLAVRRMAVERARRRELAELVTDHFLGDHHRNVLLAVVDAEREPDELRQNGRAPRPDADHLVAAGRARGVHLFHQVAVKERAFPDRTRHRLYLLLFLLPRVAAEHDEFAGALVLTGLHALGRLAPRRHRMAAAAGAPAERMVDRVHGLAADMAAPAHPAVASGLADRDVHVVGVRHRADRGDAAAMHEALLAGIEPQDDVFAVAADDLRIGAGRAGDLAALADFQLDIVHDRADRNVGNRHGIAGLHVDVFAGHHGIADREPLRRQDVVQLAVFVFDQGDEAGAVRIVFEALDFGRRIEPAALEVDPPIRLLVAAAAIAAGDRAGIVAAAGRILAFRQGLHRLAGVKAGAVDQHQLALPRRYRIVGFQCHRIRSLQPGGHVYALTLFEGDDGALAIGLLPDAALEHFPFAASAQRVDALDLDVEQLLDRLLNLRLGGVHGDAEDHLAVLGRSRRLLGDDRRQDDVVMARIAGGHLKRASRASTAARVSTSLCRRITS